MKTVSWDKCAAFRVCVSFAFQWLTGASAYAVTIKCKRCHPRTIPLMMVVAASLPTEPSSSGRGAPLHLFIIWTHKGTIPTSNSLWVICAKVNRAPASVASTGGGGGFCRRVARVSVSATVAKHNGRFPLPTTFIDRSLSAMNGCKAKGGKTLNFRWPTMALTSPSCRLGGVDFFLNRMALEGGGK